MNAHVPLPRLTGQLATATEWETVAVELDKIAQLLPQRFPSGCFNRALAAFIAAKIRDAAGEIRANVALEELSRCQNRP